MEGVVIATAVTIAVIVISEWIWRRSTKVTIDEGKPTGCTCLYFTDEQGSYRALKDTNCPVHEGE